MTTTDRSGDSEQRMSSSVLGEPRKYTGHEAAKLADVSAEFAHRFWRALGYPAADEDAVEFTDSDVAALRFIAGFIAQGLSTEQGVLQISRLVGRSTARLAESQVDVVVDSLEASGMDMPERLAFVDNLARQVMPDIAFVLGQAWRRHMAATINRMNPAVNQFQSATVGIGFADLVGFTNMSRTLSETDLLSLVEGFEDRSAEIIGDHGGRVIKMLGDEVLFMTADAHSLAATGLALQNTYGRNRHEPGLRVGLAFGQVVRHLGDVFGNTVNLASRLTGLAEPDTILTSVDMAEALRGDPAYRFTPRQHHGVKGLGSITSYCLTRATP